PRCGTRARGRDSRSGSRGDRRSRGGRERSRRSGGARGYPSFPADGQLHEPPSEPIVYRTVVYTAVPFPFTPCKPTNVDRFARADPVVWREEYGIASTRAPFMQSWAESCPNLRRR